MAALVASPRGELRGPFMPLLRSAELLDRAQKLGEFLRYRCSLPEHLREFAILVTAQHWQQRYEWHAHARLAERAGVPAEVVAALANGNVMGPGAPELHEDLATIHDFCSQLHRQHEVDDACYQQALELLGEQGVVELCGICGYYSLLAMVLNVARTPVPGNPPSPFLASPE